jgi:hypothetical protein
LWASWFRKLRYTIFVVFPSGCEKLMVAEFIVFPINRHRIMEWPWRRGVVRWAFRLVGNGASRVIIRAKSRKLDPLAVRWGLASWPPNNVPKVSL